jgi:hypothetical protein
LLQDVFYMLNGVSDYVPQDKSHLRSMRIGDVIRIEYSVDTRSTVQYYACALRGWDLLG